MILVATFSRCHPFWQTASMLPPSLLSSLLSAWHMYFFFRGALTPIPATAVAVTAKTWDAARRHTLLFFQGFPTRCKTTTATSRRTTTAMSHKFCAATRPGVAATACWRSTGAASLKTFNSGNHQTYGSSSIGSSVAASNMITIVACVKTTSATRGGTSRDAFESKAQVETDTARGTELRCHLTTRPSDATHSKTTRTTTHTSWSTLRLVHLRAGEGNILLIKSLLPGDF